MQTHQPSAFRGFHYDIARGAYLRPEQFHIAIQHAAQYGFTHFLPYLEEMIRLPSMEKACPEVAYTLNDWRAFEETAKAHHIELVPHFNVIGHTQKICEVYPELAGVEGETEMDVTLPVARTWMLSCLNAFCAASQAKHFLIGGDEWQAPNHLLKKYPGQIGQLWAEHLNEAIRFLIGHGRTPIVWHDMLTHYPDALESLSHEALIAFWFYDENQGYPFLETLKKRGFRTLMASGCHGHLNRRRTAALRCAKRSAERFHADGILMTSWEALRWEYEDPAMQMTAEILESDQILPEADALSAYSLWKNGIFPAQEALQKLKSWTRFSEYRACLEAQLHGDAETERRLYEKYQYPMGAQYAKIGKENRRSQSFFEASSPAPLPLSPQAFDLKVSEDKEQGTSLRFVNGEETFVVYPQYGATLQDWQYKGHVLIGHPLPGFCKTSPFLAGGYRSYTRAGGFRPIWALGTHSNPSILWQHPFAWEILEATSTQYLVELTLSLPHVDVRHRIHIQKGIPGFVFEATGINRLKDMPLAWNFNLPLTIEDPDHSSLSWGNASAEMSLRNAEPQWIPGVQTIHCHTPHWDLQILSETEPPAGCFLDRGRHWVTPDLHGTYRSCQPKDILTSRWRFSLK